MQVLVQRLEVLEGDLRICFSLGFRVILLSGAVTGLISFLIAVAVSLLPRAS